MSRLPPIAADGRAARIAFVVLMAIGQGAAAAVIVFATREVFAALRASDAILPIGALVAVGCGGLLLATCRLAERVMAERVGQQYVAAVRERLFLHMSRRPVSQVAEQRIGAMSLRFVGDLSAIKGWISSGLTRLMSSVVTILSSVAILFALNPKIGVAVLPILLVTLALFAVLGRSLAPVHSELRKRRSRLAADLTERLPQATALRRFGRLRQELRHLNTSSENVAKAAVRRAFSTGLLQMLPDMAAAFAAVVVLGIAWSAELSVAETAAALTTMALTVRPLRQLAGVWDRRQAWIVSRAKLEKTLARDRLPGRSSNATQSNIMTPAALQISSLKLPSNAPFNATVEISEWARLDGPKGSGKSALLLMSAGLETAPGGNLTVAGMPPFAMSSDHVVYIGRFSPILKGTLRRNLCIGARGQPDDSRLHDLISYFGLDAIVERLGGLDGIIAESGANLSRVEIARMLSVRALVVEPKLLLVDADEMGMAADELERLARRLKPLRCSALIVTRNSSISQLFEKCFSLQIEMSTKKRNADLIQVYQSKGAI